MVSDPANSDTSATQPGPLVTVNGQQTPTMVQATSGNWYAYVADLSNVIAAEAVSAGWDYGSSSCTAGIGSGTSATILGSVANTGITPYVELSIGTAATYTATTALQCLDLNRYTAAPSNVKGAPLDAVKVTNNERDEINVLQGLPNQTPLCLRGKEKPRRVSTIIIHYYP
jgi:hypothetical protein